MVEGAAGRRDLGLGLVMLGGVGLEEEEGVGGGAAVKGIEEGTVGVIVECNGAEGGVSGGGALGSSWAW